MKQRIGEIDVLRGFALLGILLMNISSYAMPTIAYFNPTVYGGDEVWNRLVFGLSHIFADQKMMALFSMLFGASVMLVTNKMEQRGESSLKFYYSRNIWLLLFGLIHSIFIWDGDVLVVYALCSFALYWFRHISPKWQFALGLFIFFVPSFFNIWVNSVLPGLGIADVVYLESFWQPTKTAVSNEIAIFQGNYLTQVAHRLHEPSATTTGQSLLELSLITEFFCRAFGMMLVGMAFYTWGIVTAKRSTVFYQKLVLFGFGLGLPMVLLSLYQYIAYDWHWAYSLFMGRIPNHIGTPLIASGYIGLVMLWCRSSFLVKLRNRLAAVGRMALTNYIGQSLIATFIFYGFGLSLFGSINRMGQLFFILVIWSIQIIISYWWLQRFQYGPLEWIWRCLSHWRWQSIQQSKLTFNAKLEAHFESANEK